MIYHQQTLYRLIIKDAYTYIFVNTDDAGLDWCIRNNNHIHRFLSVFPPPPTASASSSIIEIFCFMQWSGVEEGRKRKGMKHIETFKPQPFQMSV